MARTQNFEIDQGSDFIYVFDVRDDETGLPMDLSNYTGTAVAKKHYESNTTFSFDVTCDANGVTLEVGRSTTGNADPGDWVYDVRLYDSGSNTASYPIKGRIRINPRSTT